MQYLSEKSYWKIGGPCQNFRTAENVEHLKEVLRNEEVDSPLIIGNGTNLLFDSRGYNGSIIKLGASFSYVEFLDEQLVEVGASTWVPGLVRNLSREGYTGLEHCVGIPATVGGLVAMNGGSQRRSVSENIVSVTVMDHSGNIYEIDNDKCEFKYRRSKFKNSDLIIISVLFKFNKIEKNSSRKEMLKILKERRNKFPRKEPNCGSVFKSTNELFRTVGPPGLIIESLELKGLRVGDAQVSNKHANFIINLGNAKSEDVIKLVRYINQACLDRYGFKMEAEVIYVGYDGTVCSLDDVELII